jgi:rSAM/selenodomain-associated transferase 2
VTADIDVVIPTLNAAPHLARTLATLDSEQSIFICDGGSQDDTLAIAQAAGATIVTTEAGRGGQLAAGAAAGHASWLLFLHADTILAPPWADMARRFMTESANADRAGYFRLRFDSTDRRARRVERLAAWRCRIFGLPYCDQGLLIARDFYRKLGGFRPLPLMEDVDLVRRIGRHRLVALDADAVTSAQRYERDGWLARPMRNLTCLSLYFAGLPPSVLRRLYGS